jgi:hypothetical protein
MDLPQQPPPPPTTPSRGGAPPLQFGLKWLMVAVTIVAVLMVLMQWALVHAIIVAMLWCVLPTPLMISALYGRGECRSFAIGALVPWLSLWAAFGEYPFGPIGTTGWGQTLSLAIFLPVLAGVCGVVAVAVRRWIVRRGLGSGEPF